MGTWPAKPEPLEQWLAHLGIPDCTCPQQWKSLGRLYGRSMGNGWVRMDTVKSCPCHGEGTEHWRKEHPSPRWR